MKLYGFWRSLATYRVRVALGLKGIAAQEISVDILKGKQFSEEYRALNPQSVVPALVVDEGAPLFQSLAILEYLDETHPKPPLLPPDARGRARVRGLALIAAADGHPLIVPRIRAYLDKEMHLDEPARNKWLAHWTLKALEAIEVHLMDDRQTGRFCHGDAPTVADICLAGQVIAATAYFGCDVSKVPRVIGIYEQCMQIDAFAKAHPSKQAEAPESLITP